MTDRGPDVLSRTLVAPTQGVEFRHPVERPEPRLEGLDGLRGISVATILVFHLFILSHHPDGGVNNASDGLAGAFVAVDVFFVLSGFVLFMPMVKRDGASGRYSAFLVRRVTRLWPVYALALTAAYATHGLRGLPLSLLPPANGGWDIIVSHLFLVPTLTGIERTGLVVDGAVWTISVEMCFSLVLPLVARWYVRHPFIGLACALVLSRGWDEFMERVLIPRMYPTPPGVVPPGRSAVWITELPGYAAHFALGMTLAWVFVRHGQALRDRAGEFGISIAIVAGTVGLLCAAVVLGRYEREHPGSLAQWGGTWPVLLPLAPLVLGLALAQGRFSRLMRSGPLRMLATISYPLYLIHLPVLQIVQYHLTARGWEEFWRLAIAVPPVLVTAWLLHRLVEQPALEAGRRLARRMNTRTAVYPG